MSAPAAVAARVETWTTREAAEHLGLRQDYLADCAREGRVEAVQVDGMWLFDAESVQTLRRRRVCQAVPTLPAEPLLRHIALAGGPAEVGVWRDAALSRAYCRARRTGRVTVYQADRFAIEVLGLHPIEIWGEDW